MAGRLRHEPLHPLGRAPAEALRGRGRRIPEGSQRRGGRRQGSRKRSRLISNMILSIFCSMYLQHMNVFKMEWECKGQILTLLTLTEINYLRTKVTKLHLENEIILV